MNKILRFTAAWCGPCKMVAPVVDKIANDTGMELEVIDIDSTPDAVESFQISSVPTVIVVNEDYEVVSRVSGAKAYGPMREALSI